MESEKIVKARRIGWVNWTLLTLFFVGIPSFVHADISDVLLKFYPYVRAQEEYSNNILLSPNATKLGDYITTADAGLRFRTLQAGAYGIDLDVSGGYTYYMQNHDFNYWNASGRLNSWYALTPKLTFRLRDYLTRSDAARESQYESLYNAEGEYIGNTQPDQYLLSTARGVHAVYLRNVGEPLVQYRFGQENLAQLVYRNTIYRNKNALFEDSTENRINPLLNYWFDVRNGITLEYFLTFGHFETSPDLVGHEVRTRYTHRLDPKLSFFGEYTFIAEGFESPGVDYDVHTPSLGVEYKFSPTLVGTAQGGYFWQIADNDSDTRGPFFRASLVQTGQKTTYTLSVDGGYTRDYFTAQNLGFVKHYRGYGTINHDFTGRLSGQLTGSMERASYGNNVKDWIWDTRAGLSYVFFRWLTVTLEASYRGDNSNISANDYTEFRGMLRITLGRPGYQPGIMGGPTYR